MYIHACIVCTIIPNNASWTPFPPLFPALACMTGCLPVPWKTPHPIMFVASVGLSYFGEPKFCGPCWKGFPVQNLFCCICWLVVSSLQLRPEHKKKWPSQHFWSLVFRIVLPHLSFAIQTLQLTKWQFERPRKMYSAMSWTTSMEGKLRYHTLMIIHICKIFNFGLAVFMTSGCLSMIWEIPLQTHAQNMFIDGHIRQEWTRLQPVGRCRHLGDYGIREVPLISVSKDIVKYRFRTNQSLVHGVNPL